MARRNVRTPEAVETPAEKTPTEAPEVEAQEEEATVTATATEPEAQTEEVTEAAAPASAEPVEPTEGEAPAEAAESTEPKSDPVDDLLALSESFLDNEERDQKTGSLPEILISKFGEAYRALDSGQKRQARTKITARVQEFLDDEDDDTMLDSAMRAKSYNLLMNETKKSSAPAARAAAAAAKVDPTEAYVDQFLTFSLATMALPMPEGVDKDKAGESISTIVNAYNSGDSAEAVAFQAYSDWYRNTDTENRGDEPEAPEYVKKAFKVAEGKALGSRRKAAGAGTGKPRVSGGAQGDIAKHIAEALADVPVGEFRSIAEISKFPSKEYEGKNAPSAGAISMRLFPTSGGPSTVPNVEGVLAQDSPVNKKGARKTA